MCDASSVHRVSWPALSFIIIFLFDSLSRSMKPRAIVFSSGSGLATVLPRLWSYRARGNNYAGLQVFSFETFLFVDRSFQFLWIFFALNCTSLATLCLYTLHGWDKGSLKHDTRSQFYAQRETPCRRLCFIRCLLNFTTGHYALDSGKT